MPENETLTPAQDVTKRPSVLLSDRNPVLAEVLARQLTDTGHLDCTTVRIDADLPHVVRTARPEVFFLDPSHLDLRREYDLLDFGRDMRGASGNTRLVGYSFKVNRATLRASLDAGFRGCVSKDANLRQIEIAIAAVLAGGLYFDNGFGSELCPMMSDTPESDGLSEREKAVLVGLARGLSSKQIAHELNISNKTVDTYKSRASKKLSLGDRAKLVEYVHDQGWIN